MSANGYCSTTLQYLAKYKQEGQIYDQQNSMMDQSFNFIGINIAYGDTCLSGLVTGLDI